MSSRAARTLAGLCLVPWLGVWTSVACLARAEPSASLREVLDMSPDGAPSWSGKYLLAPLVSIIRGPSYMYAQRAVEIETTPTGGLVDLFYVRSGFQKRFEQAEAPLTVLLPSRLETGPRDSFTVRAFAEGHRQQSVTFKVSRARDRITIDLEPLPNLLEAIAHRYFAGRASIGFLTKEALTFRIQQTDAGLAVILTETAISEAARRTLETMSSPLLAEGYSQQLGEDLMVKLVLHNDGQLASEARSRQAYDAPRDLYVFALDLVPADGGRESVARSQEALGQLTREHISGCALAFDDALRSALDSGALARALTSSGAFTDRHLRAAMRRLGEISVDGVVDFVDGSQFRPAHAIELEMSISKAAMAKGYLALLRSFVAVLENEQAYRREALRSLLAPELSLERFDAALERAVEAERLCRGAA